MKLIEVSYPNKFLCALVLQTSVDFESFFLLHINSSLRHFSLIIVNSIYLMVSSTFQGY
jgi:hypothetical protein